MYSIKFGTHAYQGNEQWTQTRLVGYISKHASFDYQTHNNDIAMLRVTSPIVFTQQVRAVCIASPGINYEIGTRYAFATG